MSKLLGERLRERRKKLGLTQQQVADELNLDRTTYTYYETGRCSPSIETLYKLTLLFGVSFDELLIP